MTPCGTPASTRNGTTLPWRHRSASSDALCQAVSRMTHAWISLKASAILSFRSSLVASVDSWIIFIRSVRRCRCPETFLVALKHRQVQYVTAFDPRRLARRDDLKEITLDRASQPFSTLRREVSRHLPIVRTGCWIGALL